MLTVDDQDILPGELEGHGIELSADGFAAGFLAGHDEGTPNISVLDEAFAVGQAKSLGHLQRAHARGFGDGHDHIDIQKAILAQLAHDLAC